ncbi:MAG: archaetidylserine decarboxylase [bacterium]|nr:archaetidylserine decarboxylase [bacterium]
MKEQVKYIERETGEVLVEKIAGESALRFCYENPLGKVLLELIVKWPWLSILYGMYQDSEASKSKIKQFIKDLSIDEKEAEKPVNQYANFNEFFARKLKSEARPVCLDENKFIMPGDGRVSVIPKIEKDRVFHIKGVNFYLSDFLSDSVLSDDYEGGSLVVVRLCPADYHRFHFPYAGTPGEQRRIAGVLYSVNPIALWQKPSLFCENERVLIPFDLANGKRILLVDVGATMVGKIHQTYIPGNSVKKADERGYFTFGGSTTVIVFPPNCIEFDQDLVMNSSKGFETLCKMGSSLGSCLNTELAKASKDDAEAI